MTDKPDANSTVDPLFKVPVPEDRLIARDRALLYTRGLNMEPIPSVELALQSLHEAGPSAGVHDVMKVLRKKILDKGMPKRLSDSSGNELRSTPLVNRRHMVAEKLDRFPFITTVKNYFQKKAHTPCQEKSGQSGVTSLFQTDWERTGRKRRMTLLALILIPSFFASWVMYSLLPARIWPTLNIVSTALFFVLFSWISVGFWSSIAGILIMLRRYDRFAATLKCPEAVSIPSDTRTALLFPVYNEDAREVAEGIRTVLHSLRGTAQEAAFDIFILSDSTNPEIWVQEEEAWFHLCREERMFGRLFYRRRKINMRRKSGNIADFCRRWGANYKYMIIFDADSVMSGNTLVKMVQTMETRPDIGILQTAPLAIDSRSLIARVQQLANHLYGPVFAAGLHYWQLGDAQYWGHNAIIRIDPFMRYCQLPTLPGRAPTGGHILSHDFVESALMRRAGYGVWLAYDLGGSFEKTPPTLIDELVRDRRWCQGNLQHAHLIFTRGFFPTHRALFINGIMSYGSALLWLFFLLTSSTQAVAELFILPTYFPSGYTLFPDWPKYFPNWALILLGGTASLLFVPKILAALLVICNGGAQGFGGVFPLTVSIAGEILVSTFLAPVRMLFHSMFVVTTLLGFTVGWNPQNRGDKGTSWAQALRFHWWGTILGLLWGILMYLVNPGFFLWLSPIIIGLVVSIPLSVFTSKRSVGDFFTRLHCFITPVDINPPPELIELHANMDKPETYSPFHIRREHGFIRAVVIPRVYSLHITLAANKRKISPSKKTALQTLVFKALEQGPTALSSKERIAVLTDEATLSELHNSVWELDPDRAELWSIR